ncbi:MAG: PqqD family protein [Acidimicrobiales bacterium]
MPQRTVGDQVVLARPHGGSALVLAPTAAIVWSCLAAWTDADGLADELAARYPDVAPADRRDALDAILRLLQAEDLLERRAA